MYYVSVWGKDHTGQIQTSLVSLDELEAAYQIRVYPNPVKDKKLIIEYSGLVQQALQLILHDATGKQVLCSILKLEDNSLTNIDLSNLQPGVYSLHLLGTDVNYKEKLVILK